MTTADGWPSEAAELIQNGHRQSRRGEPWKNRDRCEQGHLFTPENTLPRPDSSPNARRCRTCKNQRGREYYWSRGGRQKKYPGAAR
jgi:hypothetical protein